MGVLSGLRRNTTEAIVIYFQTFFFLSKLSILSAIFKQIAIITCIMPALMDMKKP